MPDENKNTKNDEDEYDIISKSIGKFGRWQLQLTFVLSLFNIPCTWHIFVPTFHDAIGSMWCARPPEFQHVPINDWIQKTQGSDYCRINDTSNMGLDSNGSIINIGQNIVSCTKWEYADEGQTVISEFELVCDRKTLNNMSEMLFLGGVAVGGLICGIISDKFGRKRTLMISVFIQAVIGTLIAFVPYFELYCLLRTILGFISVSVVFSGFVLSIELVGGHWRTVAGISYLFPVALSYISISGLAWLLRDWRQLQLAISVPGFSFLALYWMLPESPRWLLAMGRTEELKKILQKAASVNKRELPPNIEKQLLPSDGDSMVENLGVIDLFRIPEMRRTTFLLFYIWFSVYLVYYGLVLNLGNIGGNLYINSVLSGAVEVPAIALSILILLKGGRRWPLALTMIVSGIACLLVLPFKAIQNNLQWLVTTLCMSSKFSISSSNAIMPVFTAELYPTTLRNIGVGASNVTAGLALMLVPYLFELSSLHAAVPMAVLSTCGITGGLCVLFLPETGSMPLQDSIKDVNESRRASKVSKNNYNS